MKLVYDVNDKPPFGKLIGSSFQQLLAIIAATIAVPAIVNSAAGVQILNAAAALVGAGLGTIVYLLFTRFKSPVFLGSSFAFISPLIGAVAFGYFGVLIGAAFAAAVYVIIAIIVKFAGSGWVNKLMPAVVIGPTVALIGLSLAGSAVSSLTTASGQIITSSSAIINADGVAEIVQSSSANGYNLVALLCGLVTLFVVVFCSVKGGKTLRLFPFIIGIAAGYILSCFFSIFGYTLDVEYLKIVNFQPFVDLFSKVSVQSFLDYPKFTFLYNTANLTGAGVANIALLYIPVAFVVFAEHIADHKNISSVIERDLLKEPGLHRTLLGDGVGSFVGSVFCGCPNTTYGESVGCVAITKNASVYSILGAAVLAIVISFFSPVMALLETIPSAVMGGVCIALYGFIAVSGLTMLQKVDLGDSKNLFVVSAILITGIGGLSLKFGGTIDSPIITISSIATALILGIIINACFKSKADKEENVSLPSANAAAAAAVAESEAEEKEIEQLAQTYTEKAPDEEAAADVVENASDKE